MIQNKTMSSPLNQTTDTENSLLEGSEVKQGEVQSSNLEAIPEVPSGVSGVSSAAGEAEPDDPNEIVFGKMSLNPGVSKTNVTTLFFAVFTNKLVSSFILSFMTQLLIDVYSVPTSQAGKVAGNLGFYASIATLCTELVIGTLMDIFGRKWASLGGLLI